MTIQLCPNGHTFDAGLSPYCPICGEKISEWAQHEIPARFRALGALTFVGSGSASRVYKVSGEREYALKVISCGANQRLREQALREIQFMKKLDGCSGVIHLIDSEVVTRDDSMTVYLLEEYGTPVVSYLQKTHMDCAERIRLVQSLCDGLIQCRDAGILHLDLKPHNLFLDRDGKVRLGDFGVSMHTAELRSNRTVRGTLGYMAPEVYRDALCSERSEIYSLGMILYRLLENKRDSLRKHDNELRVYKRLAGEPLPELNLPDEDFRRAVMGAVRKMCAFEPAQRPGSFEEVRQMICRLLEMAREIAKTAENEMLIYLDPVAITVAMSVAYSVPLRVPQHSMSMQLGEQNNVGEHMLPDMPRNTGSVEIPVSPGRGSRTWPQWDHIHDSDAFVNIGWDSGDTVGPGINPPGRVPEIVDNRDFCRVCGAVLPANGRFCPACGCEQEIHKPKMEMTKIQISALAPRKFIRGDYSMVQVVLYEEAFRHIVEELKEDDFQEKRTTTEVKENSRVQVRLTSPDLEIEDDLHTGQWCGDFLEFGFAVLLPEDYTKRTIKFNAQVSIDGVLATRLTFTARCTSFLAQKLRVIRDDVLSAFVSYASEDREEVIRVIQGMRKARPDMDIFFDVEKLRSGEDWEKALYREIENRDLLVLCWSRFAKASKWVDTEWRYALKQKGLESIDPIPLEPAEVCPPPEELEKKHFNDYLNYLSKAAFR